MYLAFPLLSALCIFIPMVLGNTELEQFETFIKQFNKVYKNEEEYQYRLSVFRANLNTARRLQEEDLGTAKYGVTKFSDLTDEEFTRNFLTDVDDVPPNNVKPLKVEAASVKGSCDWRKAGVISQAKSQGTKCGSCWAFSTVGNIEAQWAILGHPVNLSIQQLVDCVPSKNGCKGVKVEKALKWVMKNGLVSEKLYPYKAVAQKCKKINSVKTTIKSYKPLPKNEEAMAHFVKVNGTVIVRVNSTGLKHYKGGVIHPTSCDPKKTNHGVVIVGYSKGVKDPYWIIKNSWGDNWGESGFFRFYFGKNICGVAEKPVSAIASKTKKNKFHCPA
ncbi:cathepsin W-like isoform 1-T1 [Anomaloglossus baeobatrachus]|uniref:cathepsin W-like n=1 Tax=Anomaloglossus baeobatrachus TaxID=238106 RepID=UPI003F4FA274